MIKLIAGAAKCVVLMLFFTSVLSSCAHKKATSISESDLSFVERAYNFEKNHRPIQITKDTIVLDVRAFFDYQVSRIPGAVHVDAADYSIMGLYGEGLESKSVSIVRRLALMGINPFSHVVVLGYGNKGRGEEGIVALTLVAMGVEQVQIGNFKEFRFMLTSKPPERQPNQRYWEPRLMRSIVCSPLSSQQAHVIDVSGKKLKLNAAKMVRLKKKWRDFVRKKDFSPNQGVIPSLEKFKVNKTSLLMIRGYQAPIVAFSLLRMGYSNVCLFN